MPQPSRTTRRSIIRVSKKKPMYSTLFQRCECNLTESHSNGRIDQRTATRNASPVTVSFPKKSKKHAETGAEDLEQHESNLTQGSHSPGCCRQFNQRQRHHRPLALKRTSEGFSVAVSHSIIDIANSHLGCARRIRIASMATAVHRSKSWS